MYYAQCQATDEWHAKYEAEREKKADATLTKRVEELEQQLATVNGRLAEAQTLRSETASRVTSPAPGTEGHPRADALSKRMEGRPLAECVVEFFALACELELDLSASVARTESGWVSIKDRVPKLIRRTLVADERGYVTESEWDHDPVTATRTCRWPRVTHWMPLPEAPK